jgi:Flp pilus assembly pilin Flp
VLGKFARWESKIRDVRAIGGMTLKTLGRFLQDENAPTALEYAFLMTGIALVIIASVVALGGKLASLFNTAAHF